MRFAASEKIILQSSNKNHPIQSFRNDNHPSNHLIQSDIVSQLDASITGDPEKSYNTIHSILEKAKDKHFPTKTVRFKRHQHKVQPWMTDILLLNIKIKDETYVKYRKA